MLSREALENERRAHAPRHARVLDEGIGDVVRAIAPRAGLAVDTQQLVVTIVALCFFPPEHDATMLAGMGFDAWSDDVVHERTTHVVDLLVRVLAPAA